MKRIIILAVLVSGISLPTDLVFAFQSQETTTLLFVRHAEKLSDGSKDPELTERGQERAVNLFDKIRDDYKISAVYSTPYKRTLLTAKPTADSLGLQIQKYGLDNIKELLSEIIANHKGYSVLIVGHSNTTPALVNFVLGEQKYEQLDESDYGDLFIVNSSAIGNGTVELSGF